MVGGYAWSGDNQRHMLSLPVGAAMIGLPACLTARLASHTLGEDDHHFRTIHECERIHQIVIGDVDALRMLPGFAHRFIGVARFCVSLDVNRLDIRVLERRDFLRRCQRTGWIGEPEIACRAERRGLEGGTG